MNLKLILAASGAALIPAVAVPTSISLTPNSQEDLVEKRDEKPSQPSQPSQKIEKKTTEVTFEPFLQKRGPKAKEDYYMSKYRGYFMHPYRDQNFWEDKFKTFSSKRSHIITIYEDDDYDDDQSIEINKAWSPSSELGKQENQNLSLNLFCAKIYYSEGKNKDGSWDFNPSNDLDAQFGENRFWQLCSYFEERPDTVADMENKGNMPYKNPQIGYLLRELLISVQVNDEFWNKRQSEWEALESTDSTYFSPKQVSPKTIKDLCEDAYYKVEKSQDSPSKEEVKKYCGLEWDF